MYENTLKGKTGIVTAAGNGIGQAIAEAALKGGANLILNDLDQASLNSYSNEAHTICLSGDASDLYHIKELVQLATHHFGQLDFVVANAGLTEFGDFFDFTPAQFRKVIDLNLQGTFFLVQGAASQMRLQNTGGRIVIISSVIGQRAYPGLTAYAMSKAALMMMARNLVTELSPYKITINCIAPGATLTPRTAREEDNYESTWSKLVPLGKVCYPHDIAAATHFLLSEAAGHITGQTLTIDGGWSAVGKLPHH